MHEDVLITTVSIILKLIENIYFKSKLQIHWNEFIFLKNAPVITINVSFDVALIFFKWIFNGHPEYAIFVLLHALFTVLEIDCFAFFNQTAEDKCSDMTILEHMNVSDNANLK